MRITKIELQQANAVLAAENQELRRRCSEQEVMIKALRAKCAPEDRQTLIDRCKAITTPRSH